MNYVLGLIFSDDLKQVLLINKERPDWQKGLANGIGGKIEAGERPLGAMIREAREESGLSNLDWVHYMTMQGTKDPDQGEWKVYCYAARIPTLKAAETLTDEYLSICSAERLPENIVPHLDMNVSMALLAFKTLFFAEVSFQ